ncbi:extracellular calcium-sensing receptor-like [Rhinoderma darwinii]|uniref:extracellular calcium-sensing receptor-like n=1 Tax=Rhinoderma darwinii TaxID=43563 RepID=UPI003F66FA6C
MNLLLHFMSVMWSMGQMCGLPPVTDLEGIRQPGDIMIGVLLPINSEKIYQKFTFNVRPPKILCRLLHLEMYHQLQTLLFTIEEVNRDPNILSNISLGFQMYDTCSIPHYELQGALQFLTDSSKTITDNHCTSRPLFSAVIGSIVSANSIILANVLGTFRYPQISPFSSLSLLSNRKLFPSFFRTVPIDMFQSIGLAQLILSFGWTWIGLVALDNDYGFQGIQPIKKAIVEAGACVAFMEYIRLGQLDLNAPHIVKVIKESTAKVVVVFAYGVELIPIFNEMVKQNVKGRIFIGNAGWSRSTILSVTKYVQALLGTLGLAYNDYNIPGLDGFLSKIHPSTSTKEDWATMYWERVFNCQFLRNVNFTISWANPIKKCTGSEDLEDVKNKSSYIATLKSAYFIYMAVLVLAKALQDLKNCKIGEGPFSNGTCANIRDVKPWQLTYYIRGVRLKLSFGQDIYFGKNSDPPAVYSIVNWQLNQDGTLTQVKIGNYNITASPDQVLRINSSLIVWPKSTEGGQQVPRSVCSNSCSPGFRKAAVQGKPTCCFMCVPCLQGEISSSDLLNCFRCPWDQWPNPEKSMCLPKSTEFLSYEDALGAALAATSIISSIIPVLVLKLFVYHKNTPIVKASNYSLSCLLLMSLSLCFFCSFGFIGYPDHGKCLLRQVSFGLVFTLCVACILAKTIMVVLAFMATRPGRRLRTWITLRVSYMIIFICCLLQFILCVTWLSLTPPFPQYNTVTKPELIIIDCNEGSAIAFWTMLSYPFLLASSSFIVAFLARRLPDSFNEAQFITFSMLSFLSVWISYIPASLSTQGRYTVAMEIFAILASTWAVIICMFLPKCFFILFRPDMNSRDNMIRKAKNNDIKL